MESLPNFVESYAAQGGELAVLQRRGYRMEGWTYRRMADEANRVARELQSRQIRRGETVLLWGENSAEWIIAFLGCLLSGVVVVPVDSASPRDFANRVSREVHAKLVFRGVAQQECSTVPSLVLESLCQVVARHDSSPYPSPAFSRQDTAEIIFTSGTTAEPRGVVISHGNLLANLAPLEREIGKYRRYEKLVHPLRFLNLLPLSHVFGQMLGIFISPLLAGTMVFLDSLKPAEIADTLRRQRVSILIAVPRFMESLEREIERGEERDGRIEQFRKNVALAESEHFLRRWWRFRRVHRRLGWKFWAFISGGAALPSRVETFWNRLGYAVIQGYGMTETTSLITLNHPFRPSRGSIGKVFPGMEVRVDENGEILVRGENVARAYRSGGETLAVAESDGWFRTGDVAEKDNNGSLYFKGRRKNVLVTSAGMNVYPEDLEKALRDQPEVRDCVVIGLDENGNQAPCAVLLLNGPGASGATAVERANSVLAEYQKIRRWFLWPDADFPRTPTQKPVLGRIREVVVAGEQRLKKDGVSSESMAAWIERITGHSVPAHAADSNLERDLQLSSLDRVELMSALEERHQLDLNDVPFENVTTVGQLDKLLAERPALPTQHLYPTWPQNWLMSAVRLAVYYSLAWPATYLLAAPRIRGREHLAGLRGPVLFVSNHVTYLDIAWVLPALPARYRNRLATAMGGERLARMRRPRSTLSLFERLMEHLRYFLVTSLFNVFPLPQQSGFLESFRFAGYLADRGWSVLVFPEGQTSNTGEIMPFQSGIGLLAKQLNIPVVPVRLAGLYDLKREKRILTRPGRVEVVVGQPVRFASHQDTNGIARELERRIRELQSV